MLTRPERFAALACVLLALAALLVGCAAPAVPERLPHYPCERAEHGRTVFHACSADEWMYQQILRNRATGAAS